MRVEKRPGGNRYCGPAALSAIVGLTTDSAAQILREITGQRAIGGVTIASMSEALRRLGFRIHDPIRYREARAGSLQRPTLARWLREYPRGAEEVVLVCITGHFLVVKGHKIYDNHHPDGVWIRSYQGSGVGRRSRLKWSGIVQKEEQHAR